MNYGIPYMGSKSKIINLIQYIVDREYKCKYFIDMFCGGLAVSHYILQNTKMKVLANDLNEYIIDLYEEMLFNNCENISKVWYDFITREIFYDVRDNPNKYEKWYVGYVLTIWSFGNRQGVYLFGKDIEKEKEALHNALIFDNWEQMKNINCLKDFEVSEKVKKINYKKDINKRILFMKEFKDFCGNKHYELQQLEQLQRLEQLEQLQRLERLQQLQQLERLEQLQRLERLQLYNNDYLEFYNKIPQEILKECVIYCDPPYEDTGTYQVGKGFDYIKFWQWVKDCPYSIYVSSYKAPDFMKMINFEQKQVLLSSNNGKRNIKIENIYWNGKGNYEPTLYDMLFNEL